MEIAFALTPIAVDAAPVVAYDDLDIAAAMLGMQRKGAVSSLPEANPLGRRLDAVVEGVPHQMRERVDQLSMTVLSSSLASPKPSDAPACRSPGKDRGPDAESDRRRSSWAACGST